MRCRKTFCTKRQWIVDTKNNSPPKKIRQQNHIEKEKKIKMKKKKLSTSLDLKMNGLVVHVMGQINLLYIQQPLFASGP